MWKRGREGKKLKGFFIFFNTLIGKFQIDKTLEAKEE